MKPIKMLLLPLSLSCLVSACTHDYDQFDTNGTTNGTGAAAGSGGSATGGTGNTGGTGGNTGGTGGNTGGTGGNTGGTGGNTGGTGGTAGSGTGGAAGSGTGGAAGSAGMAGAGGLDGGTDAPDDAPSDVTPVTCTEPGGLSWSQNGHCYFPLPGQSHSWTTERDACIAAGAHLVTITSQEENDFVHPLAGNQGRWIGLYRPQAGDPFGWVTGEAFGYTDWVTGEPNEAGESCVRITNSTPSWRDRACSQAYGGVCERE